MSRPRTAACRHTLAVSVDDQDIKELIVILKEQELWEVISVTSGHKPTPADGSGGRKRLVSLGNKIASELSLAGFLFLTSGSASVMFQNPSQDRAWERWQVWQLAYLEYV